MKQNINDDQVIVITGAAGFIGSGIVRHLNDKGLKNLILVDDIKQTTKWKNLLGKKFIELLPINQLFSWLEGREKEIEAFIHLGACSDTLETNGDYIMENNYRYTLRLAEYALKNQQRFIYASSAATYGDGTRGFSDDHDLLDELAPLNLYGYSKHLFDLWAKEQGVLDQIVGLKYFNVFGPNENEKGMMASMVYKMTPTVQKEGKVKLFKSTEPKRFGDGDQCRDFIYIKDVAKMTCDFLENEHGGIYNIGMGKPSTWNQLARSIFQALDIPEQIEYIDMPKELVGQYQNYTAADMNKYCKTHQVQESPIQYPLEHGVKDYVQNYLVKGKRW
jgi:ADP-L-glycero-D-manno-heptose 6-epimerase